jgi:hypothetical protein
MRNRDPGFDRLCEVEQRLTAKREAGRRHPVDLEACRSGLERPRLVRHDGRDEPAAAF